jgi:hypothetical protein
MKGFLNLFRLRREERWIALAVMLIIGVLIAMMICQYSPLFLKGGKLGFWSIFEKHFRISGYDCWSYITISNMRVHFETVRHPLFFSMLYPMYLLNHWLMGLTESNYAVFFMAVVNVFCAVYSVIFLYRTLKEIVSLNIFDSILLVLLFVSFGHVMVLMTVPDHFVISLFMLTLTVYFFGSKMKEGAVVKWWQSAVLLFFTAGITVTNGAKTVISDLFINRSKFFSFKHILLSVVLPLVLLGGIWFWQYNAVEVPQQRVTNKIVNAAKKKNADKVEKYFHDRNEWSVAHHGKPLSDKPLLNLTDVTTPRMASAVENFFGESIQLHKDYLLQDVSFTRPIIVKYNNVFNYIFEGLLVALFAVALVVSRRSRLLLMLLSWWAVDLVLHFVLGFGLNEVYIMSGDWIFLIPIALGMLMKVLNDKAHIAMRAFLLLSAIYLFIWNGSLFISYLKIPMAMISQYGYMAS